MIIAANRHMESISCFIKPLFVLKYTAKTDRRTTKKAHTHIWPSIATKEISPRCSERNVKPNKFSTTQLD